VPVGPYPGSYPPLGYPVPPPPGHGYPPGYGFAPPPPRSPGGQPLAGFGDRLLAYLIDYAILLAASIPILVPLVVAQLSIMMPQLTRFENRRSLEPPPGPGEVFGSIIGPLLVVYAAAFALSLAVYYIYRVEMMFRTGQTVGKRVMKLRVVPLDPSATLTRGMATKRWLVDSVGATFVPLLVYLDGFWQLWDKPYRQCLHDKFAETTVVKVGP